MEPARRFGWIAAICKEFFFRFRRRRAHDCGGVTRAHAAMSMYIRVKRQRQTVFLTCAWHSHPTHAPPHCARSRAARIRVLPERLVREGSGRSASRDHRAHCAQHIVCSAVLAPCRRHLCAQAGSGRH